MRCRLAPTAPKSSANKNISRIFLICFNGQVKERNVSVKGIVFSFKKSHSTAKRLRFHMPDVVSAFRKSGVTVMFVILLLSGLAFGAAYAHGADDSTLQSLDFLFTTNLDARMSKGALGIFSACFASDFIFVTAIYLFGLAPWGLPFQLFTVLFKGFGTGLTAAYLIIKNGLNGLGFYLLVLLPGTFLFCIALTGFSALAFPFSIRQFKQIVSKNPPDGVLREHFLRYSSRFVSALIMTFCASLLDTVLWTLFAEAFR